MALNIPALAARGAAIAKAKSITAHTAITLKSGPTNAHNAATDVTTQTWANSDEITGLLSDVTIEEVDGSNDDEIQAVITGRAKKLIVWDSDVTAVPTERSVVVIAGETWQVKAVGLVPTDPIYLLQLRR